MAQLNPRQQAIQLAQQQLAQAGIQQPVSEVVINNNTQVSTNNVVAGPVQGRALAFKDPTIKFKTWMEGVMAKEKESLQKVDAEYTRREWSLTRSANRMLKKLTDMSKEFGYRMDPTRIGSTWGSQLKALLLVFGFGLLAANWGKIIRILGKMEGIVKKWAKFFGIGEDGTSQFTKELKYLFGGERDDERGLFRVVGDLIWNPKKDSLDGTGRKTGGDGLLNLLLDYFRIQSDDRIKAIGLVQSNPPNLGSVGNMLGMDDVLKGTSDYLTSLIAAAVGGKEALKKLAMQGVKAKASSKKNLFLDPTDDEFFREKRVGNELVATGDMAHTNGLYDFDLNRYTGELTDNMGSTYRQANHIHRSVKSSELVGTTNVMAGFERLENKINARGEDGDVTEFPDTFRKQVLEDFGTTEEIKQRISKVFKEAYDGGKHNFKYVLSNKSYLEYQMGKDVRKPRKSDARTGVASDNDFFTGSQETRDVSSFSSTEKKAEMVPVSDPRPSIDGKTYRGYGFNPQRWAKLKSAIGTAVGYKGDDFSFEVDNLKSYQTVNEFLKKRKGKNKDDHDYAEIKEEISRIDGSFGVIDTIKDKVNKVLEKAESGTGQTYKFFARNRAQLKGTALRITGNLKKWDLTKTISWLRRKNATDRETGRCAKAVRQGMEAGGLDTTGRPTLAKHYAAWLPAIGFLQIPLDTPNREGDVIVVDPRKRGSDGKEMAGHIQLWDGSSWYSDHQQSKSYENNYGPQALAYKFRYAGTTVTSKGEVSGTGEVGDFDSDDMSRPGLMSQIIEYTANFLDDMATNGLDKLKAAQEYVNEEGKKFLASALSPLRDNIDINPVHSYSGPITSEMTDYGYYLSNKEGAVKSGLSEEAWQNEVRQMTGRFPRDLTVGDSVSEIGTITKGGGKYAEPKHIDKAKGVSSSEIKDARAEREKKEESKKEESTGSGQAKELAKEIKEKIDKASKEPASVLSAAARQGFNINDPSVVEASTKFISGDTMAFKKKTLDDRKLDSLTAIEIITRNGIELKSTRNMAEKYTASHLANTVDGLRGANRNIAVADTKRIRAQQKPVPQVVEPYTT